MAIHSTKGDSDFPVVDTVDSKQYDWSIAYSDKMERCAFYAL